MSVNIKDAFVECLKGVDLSSFSAKDQFLAFPVVMGSFFDFSWTYTGEYNVNLNYSDGEIKQNFDQILDKTGILLINKNTQLRRVACMNITEKKKEKITRYVIEKVAMAEVGAGVQDTELPIDPPIEPKDPPILPEYPGLQMVIKKKKVR